MKNFHLYFLVICILATYTSFASLTRTDKNSLKNVQIIADRLIGSMESSAQAGNNRNYVDVTITHCKVQVTDIPEYMKNSTFLYVEQALSLIKPFPYRQRFIRLSPGRERGTVISSVYFPTVPKKELVNLCQKPIEDRVFQLKQIGESNCSVFLKKTGSLWSGSTPEGGCPNNYGGATYATSQVTLYENSMISWDQGWNDNGEQVWGATLGGYEFIKYEKDETDVFVNAVSQRLSGYYHNFKQAEEDPKNFLPMSFNNCPIKLKNSEFPKNSRVILIDQVADTPQIKFNRVRFLVVSKPQGDQASEYVAMTSNYAIKDKTKYHGLCKKPLEERVGDANDITHNECDMYFTMNEKRHFVGGTLPGGCASTYMGASRLEVEATLESYKFYDWERWYNDDDELVAGSAVGPYLFELQ